MSLESLATQTRWLESKVQLTHSRQQAITAAFLARFGAQAQQIMTGLPFSKIHPRTLADKIALTESREAALLAAFVQSHGPVARAVAGEAAQKHGFETGRSASKVIHVTGAAAESVFRALQYFLLDGGADETEPIIVENTPEKIVWSRVVCPQHAYWANKTVDYLFLVQIEGEWISGFVEGYCYSGTHERKIYMNVGPASYTDTITVVNPTL